MSRLRCVGESLKSEDGTSGRDNVVYHIRPRDEKHPALLNIGGQAQFRLERDKMKLRAEDSTKEFEYFVVSMTPRTDSTAADASGQPNHQR